MRPRGRRGLAFLILVTSGIAKARVLPDPVGDWAKRSRPASPSGNVADWIEKGSPMPRRVRHATSSARTPRDEKLVDTMYSGGRGARAPGKMGSDAPNCPPVDRQGRSCAA